MSRRPLITVDPLFDGWWIAVGDTPDRPRYVTQVFAGDQWDMELCRHPQPTREDAEKWLWDDSLPGYFEHNLDVYAAHCEGCGRYAKVLAFDDKPCFAWKVTECGACGVIDPRVCRHCIAEWGQEPSAWGDSVLELRAYEEHMQTHVKPNKRSVPPRPDFPPALIRATKG